MLKPKDEAELSEMVRTASGPLWIQGGGTRGPGPATNGARLSTAGMTGITLHEPGALTLLARAGTPLSEVQAALAAENQRLPFEPMDHRALLGTSGEPTIGGVVAANVSGSRRIQAGACRDALIGVRFVDGRGDILKNGGRVMKNVTGYDLVKLMAGSYGTLGVLSEVAFKVLPRPPAAATLILRDLSVAQAVQALSSALGSPFEVSGAAHAPEGPDGATGTLIRIEGFEESIAYRVGRLCDLLGPFGAVEVVRDPDEIETIWTWVRDGGAFVGSDADVWRISVKPSDAVEVAGRLEEARLVFDWGGGLIWAGVAAGRDLRSALSGIKGHATLVRAAPEVHSRLATFHPQAAPIAAISAGLRKQFDPRGILNPGRMG